MGDNLFSDEKRLQNLREYWKGFEQRKFDVWNFNFRPNRGCLWKGRNPLVCLCDECKCLCVNKTCRRNCLTKKKINMFGNRFSDAQPVSSHSDLVAKTFGIKPDHTAIRDQAAQRAAMGLVGVGAETDLSSMHESEKQRIMERVRSGNVHPDDVQFLESLKQNTEQEVETDARALLNKWVQDSKRRTLRKQLSGTDPSPVTVR